MKDYEILDELKDVKVVMEMVNEESGTDTFPSNLQILIDELISKYTPRVPTGVRCRRYCPVCGRRIRDGKGNNLTRDIRCPKCGQIFEWD